MPNRTIALVQVFTVAALCIAAAPARAAEALPPIAAAHQTLRDIIHKGGVAGNPEKNRYYISYRGYRCHSTIEIHNEVLDIDWNLVTSVADFSDFAHVYGPVVRTDVNNLRDSEKDAKFWLPTEDAAKRFAEAMRVLQSSCAPKAKTE
jgi:hypothetical protein